MSRSRRLIPCRTALALAAAAAIGPWAPIPAIAATCSWNTTSGNWATAGNWINCNGAVPSSSDIANIGSSGVVTVDSAQAAGAVGNAGAIQIDAFTLSITGGAGGGNSLNSGTITAGSLSATGSLIVSNTALGNTGGTIGVVGSGSFLDLISSSITGGTLSTSSGGLIRTDSSNVTFSGLSLSSGTQVAVQDNSVLNLVGTITNAGTISILAGASTTDVRIAGGDVLLTGGGTLNLAGVNARVVALNGSWRLTNDTQQTIQGFGQLGSSQTLLTNQGLIDANSSGNVLWVQVEQGSSANTGTMQASGGGVLHIDNSAIANGSGVIQALDSPGSASWVALSNTTIVGGTLTTTGNGTIHSLGGTSNVLANVTNAGNLLVDDNSALRLSGTMTNQGTIGVGAGGSTTDLRLAGGDVLLTGSGTVTLSSSGAGTARVVAENGAWRLTNDTQQTIQGFGQLGSNQTLLTNKGLIDANSNGNLLWVQVRQASSANPGTMQASGGGMLAIDNSAIDNTGGTIQALDGSTVWLTGGSVIGNGTLATAGTGSIHVLGGNAVYLAGVTNQGTLIVDNNAQLNVPTGSLVNNGTIDVAAAGNTSDIRLSSGNVTLSGSGVVTMGGPNARLYAGNGSWRLTNQTTIQGEGQLGLGQTLLTNNALIDANVSGHTLLMQVNASANTKTMQASGGGVLQLHGSTIDNTGGTIQALDGSSVWLSGNSVIGNGTLATAGSGSIHVLGGNAAYLSGVTNQGTLVLDDNAQLNVPTGSLVNNGTIGIAAAGDTTDIRLSSGNVTLSGSGVVTMSGPNARILANNGAWRLTNQTTIEGAGQIGASQTQITNNGVINANSGGTLAIASNATVVNAGTLRAQNGVLSVQTPLSNTGTLQADAAGQMNLPANLVNDGLMKGNGLFALTGTLTNQGHVAPGESPGTLTISGSFAQNAAGSLDIEVGGAAAGSDLLAVTGNATLGGTLNLICYGACSYMAGDRIGILTYGGTLTGTFAGSPVLTGFASGAFAVDYSQAGQVFLDVTQNTVAAIPEPASVAMLLSGLLAIGVAVKRQRAGGGR